MTSCHLSLPTIVITTVVFLQGCCAAANRVCHDGTIVPHLYAYKREDLQAFLQKNGYGDMSPFRVDRNMAGTSLYFQPEFGSNKERKILIVSVNGRVKTLTTPARLVYLNEQEEIVAWFGWSGDVQRRVNFRYGATREIPLFSTFGVDQSGRYFFIQTEPNITEIATTDNPGRALIRVNLRGARIFSKGEAIYLFDYHSLLDRANLTKSTIICQVIIKKDSRYEVVEEIRIPYPSRVAGSFGVVDIDPWSDNVLIRVSRDMPLSFWNAWYLFDLKSRQTTKIGSEKDFGFFLKEDVLEVLAR